MLQVSLPTDIEPVPFFNNIPYLRNIWQVIWIFVYRHNYNIPVINYPIDDEIYYSGNFGAAAISG